MAPDGYRDKVRANPENLFEATVASAHIHELAQKGSFIAHSIKTKVTVRAA
jgi:hypothetical protein